MLRKTGPRRIRSRGALLVAATIPVAMLWGCNSDGPAALRRGDLASVLTPDVRTQLVQGEFVMPEASFQAGEIDAAQAKALANAYWHVRPDAFRGAVDVDRGAAVHFATLRPCGQAYYAASAYRSVPGHPDAIIQKLLGAYWLVPMCENMTEEVLISVSARASDAEVVNGQMVRSGSGNFQVIGVPEGVTIPAPPELIAEFVANVTGRRIAAVPELVMRPFPKGAAVAVWRVVLDAPATVVGRTSGKASEVTALVAGHLNGWRSYALASGLNSSAANASSEEVQEFDDIDPNTPGQSRRLSFTVTRRANVDRDLELIDIGGR